MSDESSLSALLRSSRTDESAQQAFVTAVVTASLQDNTIEHCVPGPPGTARSPVQRHWLFSLSTSATMESYHTHRTSDADHANIPANCRPSSECTILNAHRLGFFSVRCPGRPFEWCSTNHHHHSTTMATRVRSRVAHCGISPLPGSVTVCRFPAADCAMGLRCVSESCAGAVAHVNAVP